MNDLSMDSFSVQVHWPVNSVIWNTCPVHYICQPNDCWLLSRRRQDVPKDWSVECIIKKKRETTSELWVVDLIFSTYGNMLTVRREAQKIICRYAIWWQDAMKTQEQLYHRPFFGKYFANIYYKNINVSTTNHFTLVDKAIYICTRKLSHRHTGQSWDRRWGIGCITVLLSQMSQVYKVSQKTKNTDSTDT